MAYADEKLFLWLNGLVGTAPYLDRVASWVVSDYLVPISMALTLIGLWFIEPVREVRQRHQIGVFAALTSMAVSSLVVMIINGLYFRPRPFETLDTTLLFYRPTDSSFPSNAVAAMFGIAFTVWVVHRGLGVVLIGVASVYAFTRVYGGVHYPSDVIAAAAVGLVVTYVVLKGRNLLMPILTRVIKAARILCLA
ncbi:MAG: phosphatase PAP2 family protein [SAR202 cluster bacterium]|nr:phosphatase PAP2 family protein [SAR202 cluster bacterium]MDP6665269.1 phosphatase PAP2 family protein [SAR202 cluster bacterium]MDP6798987.1 phosphatase PAP2 family protein [SAR202 cluster bacterium]MQG57572.1 phosphatase PAP2 family protein [SAR202 cluster bacterium]MQG70397.1 phosphatase PAP2 family protein [SAR202 cluster bacterium]